MMSYITPPVALASITAAGLAGASPITTGFQAMRLGSILFILPFLFVINPALIMQGDALEIIQASFTALVAVWLFASALEGYLYRIGELGISSRLLVFTNGALLVYPEPYSDAVGLIMIILIYLGYRLRRGSLAPRT